MFQYVRRVSGCALHGWEYNSRGCRLVWTRKVSVLAVGFAYQDAIICSIFIIGIYTFIAIVMTLVIMFRILNHFQIQNMFVYICVYIYIYIHMSFYFLNVSSSSIIIHLSYVQTYYMISACPGTFAGHQLGRWRPVKRRKFTPGDSGDSGDSWIPQNMEEKTRNFGNVMGKSWEMTQCKPGKSWDEHSLKCLLFLIFWHEWGNIMPCLSSEKKHQQKHEHLVLAMGWYLFDKPFGPVSSGMPYHGQFLDKPLLWWPAEWVYLFVTGLYIPL